jgi:hypothetical protein
MNTAPTYLTLDEFDELVDAGQINTVVCATPTPTAGSSASGSRFRRFVRWGFRAAESTPAASFSPSTWR